MEAFAPLLGLVIGTIIYSVCHVLWEQHKAKKKDS